MSILGEVRFIKWQLKTLTERMNEAGIDIPSEAADGIEALP